MFKEDEGFEFNWVDMITISVILVLFLFFVVPWFTGACTILKQLF